MFLNESKTVNTAYDKSEMEKLKPEDDSNWNLKLVYNEYPGIENPIIIWKQTSNPFEKAVVEGFKVVENNLNG